MTHLHATTSPQCIHLQCIYHESALDAAFSKLASTLIAATQYATVKMDREMYCRSAIADFRSETHLKVIKIVTNHSHDHIYNIRPTLRWFSVPVGGKTISWIVEDTTTPKSIKYWNLTTSKQCPEGTNPPCVISFDEELSRAGIKEVTRYLINSAWVSEVDFNGVAVKAHHLSSANEDVRSEIVKLIEQHIKNAILPLPVYPE